jgi:putative flippase GtrA
VEVTTSKSLKIRYLCVGLWNTAFSFLFFWLLLHLLEPQIGYLSVLTVAYPVTVAQAHFMQRRFVWDTKNRYGAELKRFVLVYIAQYILNVFLLWISVGIWSFPVVYSQIVITGILVVVFFTINKSWTFVE